MYPSAELSELTFRKALLRQRIAVSRQACVERFGEVARPIGWIDRAVVQWRKISPMVKLAAIPLGLLFRRRLVPRKVGLIRQVLRWAPAVIGAVRFFRTKPAQ